MFDKIRKWLLRSSVWIVLLGFLIAIVDISLQFFKEEIYNFNMGFQEILLNTLRIDAINPIMVFLSDLGSPLMLIGIAILTILLVREGKNAFLVFVNLITVSIFTIALSTIYECIQPGGIELIERGIYTFPMAHSIIVTAFYGLILFFTYKRIESSKIKNIISVLILTLIMFINFSRVYLGLHYISDILIGITLSSIYLVLITKTIKELSNTEKRRIKETKKVINSFKYAFSGIKLALIEERNMKLHFAIVILVILFGIILEINAIEWITCIILFGIVIAAELFNTAIEVITDIVSPERNEKAKIIKDISAGAVLITAIASAISGLIIFLPKIVI